MKKTRKSRKPTPSEMGVLQWKIHTPNLIAEIGENSGCPVLRMPLMILANLLAQVAQRAIELDDERLNALMLRLTLYSVADPSSPDYDPTILEEIENHEAQNAIPIEA